MNVPLVASGGIATGHGVAAALAAGAALATDRPTGLTRAFSGRLARGIVNRLQAQHTAHAPTAYPEIHHVTAPLRAHGRKTGDADVINLWAGEAHALAEEIPAAEVVARLAAEARDALAAAHGRMESGPAR